MWESGGLAKPQEHRARVISALSVPRKSKIGGVTCEGRRERPTRDRCSERRSNHVVRQAAVAGDENPDSGSQ
jgi:hypothetical protein